MGNSFQRNFFSVPVDQYGEREPPATAEKLGSATSTISFLILHENFAF